MRGVAGTWSWPAGNENFDGRLRKQSKSLVLGTQCKVQVFHSSAHCRRDASLRSVPLATRISLAMQGWSMQDGKSDAWDLVVKVMR